MTRTSIFASVILMLALLATSTANAQTSTQAPSQSGAKRSLAQRISALRFGWGEKSENNQTASSKSTRAPLPKNSRSGVASNSGTGSVRDRLPRLNPRNLLPQDLATSSRNRQSNSTTPRVAQRTSVTGSAIGSARARMVRDLRKSQPNASLKHKRSTTIAKRSKSASETTDSQNKSSSKQSLATSLEKKKSTPIPAEARKRMASTKSDRMTPPDPTVLSRRAPARAGSVLSKPSSAEPSGTSAKTAKASDNPATRRSPVAGRRVEMSAADLRRELLGSKPTPKLASKDAPTSRAITKSIAAEVAREFAASSERETTQSDQKKIAQGIATSDSKSKSLAAEQSGPNLVQQETASASTPIQTSETKAEEDDFQRALAESALGGASTGDRYAEIGSIEAPQPKIKLTTPTQQDVAQATKPSPTLAIEPLVIGPKSDRQESNNLKVQNTFDLAASDQQRLRASFQATDDRPKVVDTTVAPLSASEAELLMSQKMPLIASRVDGPRKIVIGRKAKYRVQLVNRGDAAADDLIARVRVPEWAEVVRTEASTGSVRQDTQLSSDGLLQWKIDRFGSQSTAKLDLTLIAREGRPIELGVNWTHAPVGARTVVEVQEPKLELQVSGPEEVLFGKPQLYRLTLSNPGTGTAEDVTIHLMPPGKKASQASSHTIGAIGAGRSKAVEIELTAREAGELAILARATATGGVEATAEKRMFCRKPGLEVDWRGPERKYTGAVATYYFRVRNPGTATAENVNFVVDLPAGFDVQAASEGQSFDAKKRRVSWQVGSLRPGDDHYMQVRGTMSKAGTNQLQIAAATSDRMVGDTDTAKTDVIALADLKLEVRDPKGPVPVGTEAVYEIRVKNRGTSSAEQVNIVALFSEGIEPFAVEGGEYSMADGRVSMKMIDRLSVGGEQVIRIRAKAISPGTHIFRAEVVCQDLEIKLTAEEMTKFYADEPVDLGEPTRAASGGDRFVYPR